MVGLVLGETFAKTLFARDVRHKALYGGRGSGKSWSVASYLVCGELEEEDHWSSAISELHSGQFEGLD